MQLRTRNARRPSGASLIEVLVSILILSFGMLAMAGLHASSLRYGKMAQFKSVATQLAYDLSDRMRANAGGATAGDYNFAQAYTPDSSEVTVPSCAMPGSCTPEELAAIDMAQARNTARVSLPGGALVVTQDAAASNVFNIWMLWLDPATADSASLGGLCPAEMGSPSPVPQCQFLRVAL